MIFHFFSPFILFGLMLFCSKAKKKPNEKKSKEKASKASKKPVKSEEQLAKEWKVIDEDRQKYKNELEIDEKIRQNFQCSQKTTGVCNFVDSLESFIDNERFKLEKYWRYKFNLFGWLDDEEKLLQKMLDCFGKIKGEHSCLEDSKKMEAFKDKMKNIDEKKKEISVMNKNYRYDYIDNANHYDRWCGCGYVENFNDEDDASYDHIGSHNYGIHYEARAKNKEWIERQKKHPDLNVEFKGWDHYDRS